MLYILDVVAAAVLVLAVTTQNMRWFHALAIAACLAILNVPFVFG